MNQVKAVVMGEGGVGKSTLISLLQGNSCQKPHSPTIGVNVEKLFIADNQIAVWDFAGQKRFQFMWEDFLRGSGLTVIVTDSSERNVKETKELLKQYDKKMGANVIAIANKQDLPGRLTPEQVQNELGIPTYGMVAVDNRNFGELYNIISTRILQAQNN